MLSPGWSAALSDPAAVDACPVNLDIRHESGLVVMHRVQGDMTDGTKQPLNESGVIRPAEQRLDLKIHNLGLLEIASIDGIVQIDTGTARMVPLGSGSDHAEAVPLHLTNRIGKDEEVDVRWSAANTNPVAYVDIGKVTYKDGSSWAPAGRTCRYKPNPMMLISSR